MNALQKRMILALAVPAASLAIASATFADPLVGRDLLKFSQQPMDGTPFVNPNGATQLFWGHDELSTAYSQVTATGPTPYRGTFMADDFADKFASPVVHVKWWGSYFPSLLPTNIPINKFLISFESDQPVDANNRFSRPDTPLLNQIVNRGPLAPGSGTFTETFVSPGGPPLNEALYEYNAELHVGKEFFQKPDTVYWLKIVALVDLPAGVNLPDPTNPTANVPRWAWHNRDYTITNPLASTPPAVSPGEDIAGFIGPAGAPTPVWHFQDDAVTGVVDVDHLSTRGGLIMPLVTQGNYQPTRYLALADGPGQIGNFSKDLAFELYTIVPEPTSCLLLVCGCIGLAIGQRHRVRD